MDIKGAERYRKNEGRKDVRKERRKGDRTVVMKGSKVERKKGKGAELY